MDLTGHANQSTTTKDEKVPGVNGFQSAYFVQPKDGDELQVITIGELEVQLRADGSISPSLHNSHQFRGNLFTNDTNADPYTRGGNRDELQDKKDSSNQVDEKDDLQSEEPLGDQDDTKQKVAEGQISRLSISEKRNHTPTISRPILQLLTEEEMADVVKKVLEKERVHNVPVKNSKEKEFVLEEHMFPSLASVHTPTNQRA